MAPSPMSAILRQRKRQTAGLRPNRKTGPRPRINQSDRQTPQRLQVARTSASLRGPRLVGYVSLDRMHKKDANADRCSNRDDNLQHRNYPKLSGQGVEMNYTGA